MGATGNRRSDGGEVGEDMTLVRQFTVECTEPCPECEGNGWYQNPLWAQMFSDLEAIEKQSGKRIENFDAFFKQWALKHAGGEYSMGLEECQCDECGGRGQRSTKVPLVFALQELGILR